MNMEEYFRALESYVASHKLNLGDGDSVLSLLYEAYGDINRMYDDQIKADFAELYISGIERNADTGNGLDYQSRLRPLPGS